MSNKVTITTADLERLLKMSLRYALPSNGSSPSVVADLFKSHIGELRTEFIEWAMFLIFTDTKNGNIDIQQDSIWDDLMGSLRIEIKERNDKCKQ